MSLEMLVSLCCIHGCGREVAPFSRYCKDGPSCMGMQQYRCGCSNVFFDILKTKQTCPVCKKFASHAWEGRASSEHQKPGGQVNIILPDDPSTLMIYPDASRFFDRING